MKRKWGTQAGKMEILKHAEDKNYQILNIEEINNSKDLVSIVCKRDDYTWETTVDNFIRNKSNCARCSNKERWNTESKKNELLKIIALKNIS